VLVFSSFKLIIMVSSTIRK